MKKATEKQRAILKALTDNKEPMAKKKIVELFDGWYYANASKHIGDVLTRMVDSGLIHRPSRGLYQIGGNGKSVNKNQTCLF